MENTIPYPKSNLHFRHPELQDGQAIYELIQACPPLDLNSSYLYFLQASHFADTCIIAERNQAIVGFVSAYRRPDKPGSLFIWQVAVAESERGKGLAKRLLQELLLPQNAISDITEICCTISPSNIASQTLFKSLAKTRNLQVKVTPFIADTDFGSSGHEAEDLYCLSDA